MRYVHYAPLLILWLGYDRNKNHQKGDTIGQKNKEIQKENWFDSRTTS